MTDAATVSPETTSAAIWWVQVRGQAYGPYTLDQLKSFVEEGRVRPNTPVSLAPEKGWQEARRIEGLMASLQSPEQPADRPAPQAAATIEAANLFVHAEIRSGAWMAFLAALEGMGVICEMAPGFYLIRTHFSVGVLRNTLSQTLERGDRFVVIDATRDRLAWFNLGPEMDARIRDVWNGPLRADRAKKA